MRTTNISRLAAAIVVLALTTGAFAHDWTNLGGNAARNGLAPDVVGPTALDVQWANTDDYSIISWHPFIHDGRVFVIRESGFPQQGGPANDALVAYDLRSGIEAWRLTLPYGGNPSVEWIAWIAGANGGRVYASRASNLQPQPVLAYDAATGDYLWTSEAESEAFAYDGAVFAGDGDLILGDRLHVVRIDAIDGSTVWDTERNCSVSGNCGPAAAISQSAVYIDEVDADEFTSGQVITRIDLETGGRLYSSPIMTGFLAQSSPFLSPDETTVYYSRTQNNPAVDFLYAFEDTGTEFIERWRLAAAPLANQSHGIGPDGTVYAFLNGNEFVGLDPATGHVLYTAGVLSPMSGAKLAIDGMGTVYVSNGWASTPATDGRLWAFNADLSVQHFVLPLDRQNQGGPSLGGGNLLVVADRVGVYAYHGTKPGDFDGNGVVDLEDFALLFDCMNGPDLPFPDGCDDADFDADGDVDLADATVFLLLFEGGI